MLNGKLRRVKPCFCENSFAQQKNWDIGTTKKREESRFNVFMLFCLFLIFNYVFFTH